MKINTPRQYFEAWLHCSSVLAFFKRVPVRIINTRGSTEGNSNPSIWIMLKLLEGGSAIGIYDVLTDYKWVNKKGKSLSDQRIRLQLLYVYCMWSSV